VKSHICVGVDEMPVIDVLPVGRFEEAKVGGWEAPNLWFRSVGAGHARRPLDLQAPASWIPKPIDGSR